MLGKVKEETFRVLVALACKSAFLAPLRMESSCALKHHNLLSSSVEIPEFCKMAPIENYMVTLLSVRHRLLKLPPEHIQNFPVPSQKYRPIDLRHRVGTF